VSHAVSSRTRPPSRDQVGSGRARAQGDGGAIEDGADQVWLVGPEVVSLVQVTKAPCIRDGDRGPANPLHEMIGRIRQIPPGAA
jgi:hypothetical protein